MVMIKSVEVTDGTIHIEDEDGIRVFPVYTVAAYAEFFGYDSYVQALEAVLNVQEIDDAEVERQHGRALWADVYALMERREEAREQEAFRALEEGKRDDPRSPRLRSALAAYKSVHEPIDGGECVMDRCRRAARNGFNLPEPTKKASAHSRHGTAADSDPATHEGVCLGYTEEDRDLLRELVEVLREDFQIARRAFLHNRTRFDVDPIEIIDPAQPDREPAPEPETVEDVMEHYRNAS